MGTMRINQNISALNSYRNLSNTNTVMGKSLEKLSSGFRINRAADDAAGLVISQGLRAQVSGLRQATRNAQDGISVVQTAEGALNEVHSMLNRMRDLAVQSVNASNDSDARTAANNEITELKGEIARIADQTKFGSQKLLDGSFGATPASVTGVDADGAYTVAANDDFTLNINGTGAVTVELSALTGANATDTASALQTAIRSALAASGDADIQAFADKVTVTGETVGTGSSLTLEISGLADGETFTLTEGTNNPLAALGLGGAITAADGDAALFQVGANAGETIEVKGIDLAAVATAITGDVTTAANATAFISAMDDAIADVSGFRGQLGAVQNRFESTINNLQVTTENLAASESRIRDTDMALEMVSFTRHQILTQAGTAMLGQANQLPQGVLRLLG
ncbi:flagellin [Actinomarinicola tropica]|uniref:Flagellin n=2 Tax=Actinomarinicola tropica TaxID=2789776 RepID=A0A5Q2RJR6_9ACTN|nr:flagellin [Actinomarinicola tropica]